MSVPFKHAMIMAASTVAVAASATTAGTLYDSIQYGDGNIGNGATLGSNVIDGVRFSSNTEGYTIGSIDLGLGMTSPHVPQPEGYFTLTIWTGTYGNTPSNAPAYTQNFSADLIVGTSIVSVVLDTAFEMEAYSNVYIGLSHSVGSSWLKWSRAAQADTTGPLTMGTYRFFSQDNGGTFSYLAAGLGPMIRLNDTAGSTAVPGVGALAALGGVGLAGRRRRR
jgi:hypothetical protein